MAHAAALSQKALPVALAWTAVAAGLAFQGHLTGLYSGTPQPWWPAFQYSLASASVWAMLTPLVVMAAPRAWNHRPTARITALLAGFVLISALHVTLFSLAYWPFYGAGQHPTLLAMGLHLFVRNVALTALFYAALVAIGLRHRPEPSTAPTPEVLEVRRKGAIRLLPLASILWLRAAGNYAEAITADGPVLIDESLASLSRRLPDTFVRVHRGAIVRLAAIQEVRSRGHGDADLVLADGQIIRLSRRYRPALRGVLSKV